jgi:hypothetical protein
MGTQVLKGSKGNYKPLHSKPEFFGNTEFTVTADTCLDADKLPVKFKDAAEGCWISMKQAILSADAKYSDYQGKP